MAASASGATADAILDVAERFTQRVGYNGLSFRDVAAAVGIKSASVHYHYPSKGQLGAAIARRYTDRLLGYLANLDAHGTEPGSAMAAYVAVFGAALEQDGRMCLCGMLAAETDALPPEIRDEVRRFIELNVDWIARTIERATGASASSAAVRDHGAAIFAALEGAVLIARGCGDPARFHAIAAQLRRTGLVPF